MTIDTFPDFELMVLRVLRVAQTVIDYALPEDDDSEVATVDDLSTQKHETEQLL